MAKPLRPKRGTTAKNDAFTGLASEITIDTEKHSIRVHDGVTAGGHEILPKAKNDELYITGDAFTAEKALIQKAIDDAVAELEGNISELGKHNVGEEWVSYLGKIPEGGVPYCGQEVTRVTYADLWSYAQAQGLVKSESEWQSIASAQGGNVPFYSSGDGSTTFRMPKIVGYVKGASSQSEVGKYIAEGLPNIVGHLTAEDSSGTNFLSDATPSEISESGAFHISRWASKNTMDNGSSKYDAPTALDFDASRSNSIYGNSNHVTPETSVVMFGVYAFGEVTNQGSLDAETLATGLATVEFRLGELEPLKNVGGLLEWGGKEVEQVNETGVNGEHSYIRFESGLQIIWGAGVLESKADKTFTHPVPFVDNTYRIAMTRISGASTTSSYALWLRGTPTATYFKVYAEASTSMQYVAIGKWK